MRQEKTRGRMKGREGWTNFDRIEFVKEANKDLTVGNKGGFNKVFSRQNSHPL